MNKQIEIGFKKILEYYREKVKKNPIQNSATLPIKIRTGSLYDVPVLATPCKTNSI